MSSFTEPLELTPVGYRNGKLLWATLRPFAYEIGLKGSGLRLLVPEGFQTDLMTMPRIFWPFLPPHDPRYAAACVLHDYLCRWQGFSRVVADAVFYEALRVLGVGWFKATLIYAAVRLWGALTAPK